MLWLSRRLETFIRAYPDPHSCRMKWVWLARLRHSTCWSNLSQSRLSHTGPESCSGRLRRSLHLALFLTLMAAWTMNRRVWHGALMSKLLKQTHLCVVSLCECSGKLITWYFLKAPVLVHLKHGSSLLWQRLQRTFLKCFWTNCAWHHSS